MPYGTGPFVRQALVRATPWQRCLIAVAMVAGGAALVVLGHVAGAALAVAGVLLLGRMVRFRLHRRHATAGAAPEAAPTEGTGGP
jgi:hypothetical protein